MQRVYQMLLLVVVFFPSKRDHKAIVLKIGCTDIHFAELNVFLGE